MEKDTRKIAFFDSGMGGLTVLHQALQVMPNEQYIYFADADHAPYGIKSSQLIKELVFDAVDFLAQFELKALVLACNTATSVAVKDLRATYNFPIIGMEPAIKPAVESSHKKTLVCATDKTLAENKLRQLILNLDAADQVEQLSLQKLVLYAEKLEFDHPKINSYLKACFADINWNDFDSIVLGCTHFPYFRAHLQALLPTHIRILDGNEGTVKHLKSRIKTSANPPSPIDYFISKKQAHAHQFEPYFELLNQLESI